MSPPAARAGPVTAPPAAASRSALGPAVLAAFVLCASAPAPLAAQQAPPEAARIRLDTFAYDVRFGGERLGVLTVSYERTEAGRLRARESLRGTLGDESTTYVTTPAMRPISARREGRLGAASSGLDLRYEEGRVAGHATVASDSTPGGVRPDDTRRIEVDRPVPAGTLDSNTLVAALLASPLAVGDTLRYRVFRPGRGVVRTRARVVASESVTVPAGRYPAYRVELSTDQGEFTLWVTRETPRFLVRQTFRDRPVEVVLRSVGAAAGGRPDAGRDTTPDSAATGPTGPGPRAPLPPGGSSPPLSVSPLAAAPSG